MNTTRLHQIEEVLLVTRKEGRPNLLAEELVKALKPYLMQQQRREFRPVPKPSQTTKRYQDSDNEYVPEGEENTERHEATPIELLIGQLTGMKHFSATNKRKMYDPVGVLFGGEHIMEGSPAEELEKHPYEFTEWVKARNTWLRQNGGTSAAKLLQSIRNGYDTEKYGWLARRPKPAVSPDDEDVPWR